MTPKSLSTRASVSTAQNGEYGADVHACDNGGDEHDAVGAPELRGLAVERREGCHDAPGEGMRTSWRRAARGPHIYICRSECRESGSPGKKGS